MAYIHPSNGKISRQFYYDVEHEEKLAFLKTEYGIPRTHVFKEALDAWLAANDRRFHGYKPYTNTAAIGHE